MLGWKAVQRTINPSVSFEKAQEILQDLGFRANVENPTHIILKRVGIKLTVKGASAPIELALAKEESGLSLQLRYDTFVLFDTGDLDRFADKISAKLTL